MHGFEKTAEHLLRESIFRQIYEQSQDPTYHLPHSHTYYQPYIQQSHNLYPGELILHHDLDLLDEDRVFIKGTDTVFYHHMTWFPPVWHTTDFFVVQAILKGEMKLYIANQEIHLTTGDICIVVPDSRHALSCFSDSSVLCACIRKSTFEHAFFSTLQDENSILADFFQKTLYGTNPHPFLYFHCGWDEAMMNIFRAAREESFGRRSYHNHMMNSLMDLFFITLLRNHEKDLMVAEKSNIRQSEDLIYLLKYMQEHYTTVSLKELAEFFNYSERHIQRILKQSTGAGFMENIQIMKMREAARLLTESRYPISKIAVDLGYNNLGNFRKIFRRTYGKSPAEYHRGFSKA